MKCFHLSLLLLLVLFTNQLTAQRVYTAQSVLSTGNWYKLAIKETGMYKVDVAFLASMGINTSNVASNTIRLYGNTGAMLGEACNATKYDDLEENAIEVVDGGDGVFNGSDYFIFYGSGTDYWQKDSLQAKFTHQKNYYSNEAYYYISIGGTGKRLALANPPTTTNTLVNSYNERFFIEENTVNLISSGKNWFGTELSNLPGRALSKQVQFELKNKIATAPIILTTSAAARAGITTRLDVAANTTPVQQIQFSPVTGTALDFFANQQTLTTNYNSSTGLQNITLTYQPISGTAQAFINYLAIHSRCALSMQGYNQLSFRDWQSVGAGNNSNFIISNTPNNTIVWDVTVPTQPVRQLVQTNANTTQFAQATERLKEFIAFSNTGLLLPTAKGTVANQNLHNTQPIHYLIITTEALLSEAQRLANYHITTNQLQTKVVLASQIYNEFGGGIGDVTAVRDFVKMYYDRYNTNAIKLQSVLLLGDASYDYLNRINNNTNQVPSWQSSESLNPLASYVTDDFFGYLDDNEDINTNGINLIDIGIGRIPAHTVATAKSYVDKVIGYHTTATLGSWRNQLTFIADDEDGNLHLNDAEILTNTAANVATSFVQDKIYVDAYRQQSGSGGSRYPDVNNALNNKIADGTLLWNYSGHGSNSRLGDEAILDGDMVTAWQNQYKLPLFITATCDFAPFDDPTVQSIGENLLLQPKSGAIALMTTTRIVFAFSNRVINNNYLQTALQRTATGRYLNLGEANRQAKNLTVTSGGDVINSRKFTLLGDPALTIAYPKHIVRTTKINNRNYTPFADTIKATNAVQIEGEVMNINGSSFNNFNGKVTVVVYDKKQTISTLANDVGSVVTSFQNNGNILYKGGATVVNGKFSVNFIAPRDMQYAIGQGLINYYAQNDTTDANGSDAITIGGTGTNTTTDNEGPIIKAYLNDTKFVNGSLTNQQPLLIVLLSDTSGINTSNVGVGHEITAVIDGDTRNTIILNNNYQAEDNNFRKGTIRYLLPKLKTGTHQIVLKAWDVFNNSSNYVLDCRVGDDGKLTIDRVLNYPNPFTTKTTFWFEHNRPAENLRVLVSIYSLSGKLIKQLSTTINTTGNRSCEVEWDGKDQYGDKVARGIYIYQLQVADDKGQKVIKKEKIVKF